MPWRTVRMSGKIGKANTFYIDFTNGNDSRSGHSMGEAWKTITKVNGATFNPGDRILFKRGETWGGIQLIVPASNLYFGVYGSGAKPIIDGSDAVDCVSGNGKDYLTFENLEVTQGLDFGFAFSGENHISLYHCDAHDCGNDQLIFTNCTTCTVFGGAYYNAYTRLQDDRLITGIEVMDSCNGITIDSVECYGNVGVAAPAHYGAGIGVHGHVGTSMPQNITIQNCNIHDEGLNNFGIRVNNLVLSTMTDRNILIQNNTITANAYGGIQINSMAGTDYLTNGVTIRDNQVLLNTTQYGIGIYNSANVSIYRNLITNNNNVQAGQNIGVQQSTNVNVWNNTTYSLFDNFWYDLVITGALCDSIVVKNNIFGGTIASKCNISIAALTGVTGMVIDNNLYQYTGVGNRWTWLGVAMSYATWLTNNSNDANSPARADPLFVNPATNDFTLQALSPAIDAGVDVGLPYLGVAPDCGYAEKA